MKLVFKLVIAVLVVFTLGVLYLVFTGKGPQGSQNSKSKTGTQYFTTGSDYKGNYVFGGAMQLAVNELNNSILHEKLQLRLDESDIGTKRLLDIFNLAEFTTSDLDPKATM